jgi:two-component system, OmpR family, sensor kinase
MRQTWLRRARPAKLRTRVLAGVLLVTLVALAAFDVAAITALRSYLTGQTDSQLRSVLALYQLVDGPASRSSPPSSGGTFRQVPARQRTEAGQAAKPPNRNSPIPAKMFARAPYLQPFSVLLVSGKTVKEVSPRIAIRGVIIGGATLMPALPVHLAALAAGGQGQTVTSRRGHQPLRIMAAPTPGGGIIVAVTSLNQANKTAGQLELILVIGSAAAGLLAAGGVAWVMRRGLRPVETMAGQADAITAGDLTSRVSPLDPRTEVGRLGVALNGMLARIEDFVAEREASQEATRRFFADASHELRTPLASLRANAELYQQGALPERPQVDEAMRRITLEAKRMSGLVDDMLRLARLDQHPGRQHEPVDVTAVLEDCAERAQVAGPARTWQTSIAHGLTVIGDEELLRQATDNLLANVHAHTPAGAVATITAAARDGTIVIEVSDDGPGVPDDQLPRIFERFYRATAPSRRPGSGLGLAIVTAVAAAHGGAAEARPNHPHGLRVTVTLPAAPVLAVGLTS